ncbi:MAG: transcriptional repressor LexA [Clostridia bacterium]|nr:transcriptional repressor LexA [Clostridia bacterium]
MQVLEFISNFSNEYGYPPSVREMCSELNISSTATIHYYLKKLTDEGYIKKADYKNRCIEIVNNPFKKEEDEGIPVVGKVAAGLPITAVENIEDHIKLPSNMFKGDELFILNVSGESMINAGIFDGDQIVVRQQATANNGEKVVALIDDSATVKTFYKENGHIRLQPENDTMDPIIVPDCTILGVVVGLIRKYK